MTIIVHFFSYVAYIWVPGAKTTGPIVKKFQCDPFSNKKDVSQSPPMGLSEMAYFSTKLGTSVDGYGKIII
jgi:hypothetical protein